LAIPFTGQQQIVFSLKHYLPCSSFGEALKHSIIFLHLAKP
jgi:hypothetical protein